MDIHINCLFSDHAWKTTGCSENTRGVLVILDEIGVRAPSLLPDPFKDSAENFFYSIHFLIPGETKVIVVEYTDKRGHGAMVAVIGTNRGFIERLCDSLKKVLPTTMDAWINYSRSLEKILLVGKHMQTDFEVGERIVNTIAERHFKQFLKEELVSA